jgi:calcineurin-like phosphoesterase family protein
MLSNVWFTSDLHLGHELAAKNRGFASVEEHDAAIIYNINKVVNKNDKLFILGDLAMNKQKLEQLSEIRCRNKELLIGNHDLYQTQHYLRWFTKVHGFRKYENYWLSHCPVHPQEMYRTKGNIHGHIHKGAATHELPLPYYNVNVDFHNCNPVNFTWIKQAFGE